MWSAVKTAAPFCFIHVFMICLLSCRERVQASFMCLHTTLLLPKILLYMVIILLDEFVIFMLKDCHLFGPLCWCHSAS